MKKRLLIGFLSWMLISCKTSDKDIIESSINEVSQINFSTKDTLLIDVRTAEEFSQGHLSQAINLNLKKEGFKHQVEKLDTSKTYYIYCRSGNRSQKAVNIFKEKGFSDIIHLSDGYINYKEKE